MGLILFPQALSARTKAVAAQTMDQGMVSRFLRLEPSLTQKEQSWGL